MRLGRALVIAALAAAPAFGTVTSSSAQSSVNAANSGSGTDASSGSAKGTNSSGAFTGQQSGGSSNVGAQDANNTKGTNVQEGNNRTRINQTTTVKTGSAVAGQVIGAVVGAGNLVVNATNHSDNVDVQTGNATGTNSANVFTGLAAPFAGLAIANNSDASAQDLNNVVAKNIQEGDNTTNVRQSVNSTSGDGIAGQVIGAVVNGGTTDITAANTTTDSTVETGDANGSNKVSAFTGLLDTTTGTVVVGDVNNANGTNIQEGDNRFTGSQSAHSLSGAGIAGEVLGVVSSGNTRVDASNKTTDSDATTGTADSANSGGAFTGLGSAAAIDIGAADINGANGTNVQEGDNTSRLNQTADAVTGEAVAGQVAGVVTSAGGSADLVLANTSDRVDATSGQSTISNIQSIFSGLSTTSGALTVSDALGQIFKGALT
jgi:hypothetical protein